MSDLSLLLACLRALDIEEAVVSLDGSGDSGDATFDHCVTRSGETLYVLPHLTVGLIGTGHRDFLPDLIVDVAADVPDGDWVNNEGGFGDVTLCPFEEDEENQVCCDMTYRDEYEHDGAPDFDDEDEEETRNSDETDAASDTPEHGVALPIVTHSAGGTT